MPGRDGWGGLANWRTTVSSERDREENQKVVGVHVLDEGFESDVKEEGTTARATPGAHLCDLELGELPDELVRGCIDSSTSSTGGEKETYQSLSP